jgi:hypothetical protein
MTKVPLHATLILLLTSCASGSTNKEQSNDGSCKPFSLTYRPAGTQSELTVEKGISQPKPYLITQQMGLEKLELKPALFRLTVEADLAGYTLELLDNQRAVIKSVQSNELLSCKDSVLFKNKSLVGSRDGQGIRETRHFSISFSSSNHLIVTQEDVTQMRVLGGATGAPTRRKLVATYQKE